MVEQWGTVTLLMSNRDYFRSPEFKRHNTFKNKIKHMMLKLDEIVLIIGL